MVSQVSALKRRAIASIGVAMAAFMPGMAEAMSVRPVIVDLGVNARAMTSNLEVSNVFESALPVELTVREVTFPTEIGTEASYKPAEDIIIFPPQAIIQPGQSQNFRLQYIGDPAIEKSRHFVVTVAQLPVKLPEGQSAIQILYNFQVLVSVGVPGQRSNIQVLKTELETNAEGVTQAVMTIKNDTQTYGYLADSRLRLTQRDAAGRQVFQRTYTPQEVQQTVGYGLMGPGQTRKINIPVTLPSREGTATAEVLLDARRR
jgi:fimbrial chaperone protein